MCKELATVRDLIGVDLPFTFNVNKKNILQKIQYKNYIKSKPIYKSELKKLIKELLNLPNSSTFTNYDNTLLQYGFKVTSNDTCEYYIYNETIRERQYFSDRSNIIVFNKKNFCKITSEYDSIFIQEGQYLLDLSTYTDFIDKECLISCFENQNMNCEFEKTMFSLYKHLDSIAKLSSEQILCLWFLAKNKADFDIEPSESSIISTKAAEIFKEFDNIVFTQMSYDEYSSNEKKFHIAKSRISGAERIHVTLYDVLTNNFPNLEKLSKLEDKVISNIKNKGLAGFIEYQYNTPETCILDYYIDTNDLKFYPYWKK